MIKETIAKPGLTETDLAQKDDFAHEKFLMPLWAESREQVKTFMGFVIEFLEDNCTDKQQSTDRITKCSIQSR